MSIIPGPSVAPQYYGGDVGGKIADALATYYQLNRQKQLDALQYGIGLKWPDGNGGAVSTDAPVGIGDRLRQAFQKVTGQGVQATPGQIAATRTGLNALATNQATANRASLAGTDSGSPVAAGSYVPGSGAQQTSEGGVGGLPEYMQLPNGQRIPTIMTPFGSKILQALKIRSDIALAGTEADKNTAEAGLSRRKASVPMPQDANYVTTMQPIWGGEASAKANAQLPVKLEEIDAQNQGRLGAARISAGATLGAAGIGAKSRENVANITQGGANQRQANEQQWEGQTGIPLRAGTTLYNREAGDVFGNQFSITGRFLHGLGLTPTQPTVQLPALPGTSSTTAAPQAPAGQGGLFGDLLPPKTRP